MEVALREKEDPKSLQSRCPSYNFVPRSVTFCHQKHAGFAHAHAIYAGTEPALLLVMKIYTWIRHGFIISALYAIGLVELHYLPRYGLEYFLGAIGLTAFTAGFWMRTHWDV